MNKKLYKKGDNVRLVDNQAGSLHKIGTIGTVVETRIIGDRTKYYLYLIADKKGYAEDGATWSYGNDLESVISNLSKNTRTL